MHSLGMLQLGLIQALLHMDRSPYLWKDPDTFRPERFSETNSNPEFNGAWAGYRPEAQGSSMYPNEVQLQEDHRCINALF